MLDNEQARMIASAVIAERERCARLNEEFAVRWEKSPKRKFFQHEVGRSFRDAADVIRRG